MCSFSHSFARHLPEKIVTNNDLSKLMETSDEWIQKRTGIEERRFVEAPTTTSDLATEAAKKSLQNFSGEIDAIIAATLSPDYDFPGIGVLVQNKLQLNTIPAFDIRNQCSGFLYGLELADSLITSGKYNNILLIGAEVHSTGLDLTTRGRDIAVLFGDGAGSCIVGNKESIPTDTVSFEFIDSELHSDGAHAKTLWCEHVGSAHFPKRVTKELVEEARVFPQMEGRVVFEHAVKRMIEVSTNILKKNKVSPDQIKMLVPHQANLRINQMVAKHLGVSDECVSSTIKNYGNTTAATIPIGLSHVVEETDFQSGDFVLSCAFGSGFTWGACLLKAT